MRGVKEPGRNSAPHLKRPLRSDGGRPRTWSDPEDGGSTAMTPVLGDLEDSAAEDLLPQA